MLFDLSPLNIEMSQRYQLFCDQTLSLRLFLSPLKCSTKILLNLEMGDFLLSSSSSE